MGMGIWVIGDGCARCCVVRDESVFCCEGEGDVESVRRGLDHTDRWGACIHMHCGNVHVHGT